MKIVRNLVVICIVLLLAPKPIYADTLKVDFDISGKKFFEKVNAAKENKDIIVDYYEYEPNLVKFAEEIEKNSKIHFTYEPVSDEVMKLRTKKTIKLLYTTDDIKEMETGNYVFDAGKTSGKEFVEALHNSKANSRIKVYAKNRLQLLLFQLRVKQASPYGLSYGIYTKDNIEMVKASGFCYLFDRTKDLKACEDIVAGIDNWGKMTCNEKFLALSEECNKISQWKKDRAWTDFHFYDKDNHMVCYDYSYMYKRIAEILTYTAETEFKINRDKDVNHQLILVCIDGNYYEGNNHFLVKDYNDKRLSFRAWYNQDKERFDSDLAERFLQANGY